MYCFSTVIDLTGLTSDTKNMQGHMGQGHGTLTAINQARRVGCVFLHLDTSYYQLIYRQDGTGADETTELMSGLDGYGWNAGQSDTNIKYVK